MNADELTALNEQIAGMARAGLPLDQGLAGLAREMSRGRLRRVTMRLADDLRAGHPLPEAIARQKGQLPPYYAGLVTAGVRSGRVGEVLTTLSTYSRAVATTRTTILEALFYPAVVVLFAAALFFMVVYLIIPRFEQIFQEFGLQLPAFTQAVLAVGRLARQPEFVIVTPLTVLIAVAGIWAWFRATESGRRTWARAVYTIPIVGTLIRAARLAAFTDLLAVLVEHGLPLPEAFRLAADATSDPVMAEQAHEAADELEAGEPIGVALRGKGLVPEWVAWMTGAGAERGNLGPALRQIAAVYRRQIEARAVLLRTVLPPFLILLTAGVLIGGFILAVMLPIVKLMEALSR